MLRLQLYRLNQRIDVSLSADRLKCTCFVFIGKQGIFDHIERMVLDRIDSPLIGCFGRIEHHLLIFARQAEYQVAANIESLLLCPLYRCLDIQDIVPPIDTLQGFIIYRLDTIFDPNLFFPAQLHEIIKCLLRHAVTARTNAQSDHVIIGQCLVIEYFDRIKGGIGIGKCLEIDQKFLRTPLSPHLFAGFKHL